MKSGRPGYDAGLRRYLQLISRNPYPPDIEHTFWKGSFPGISFATEAPPMARIYPIVEPTEEELNREEAEALQLAVEGARAADKRVASHFLTVRHQELRKLRLAKLPPVAMTPPPPPRKKPRLRGDDEGMIIGMELNHGDAGLSWGADYVTTDNIKTILAEHDKETIAKFDPWTWSTFRKAKNFKWLVLATALLIAIGITNLILWLR